MKDFSKIEFETLSDHDLNAARGGKLKLICRIFGHKGPKELLIGFNGEVLGQMQRCQRCEAYYVEEAKGYE